MIKRKGRNITQLKSTYQRRLTDLVSKREALHEQVKQLSKKIKLTKRELCKLEQRHAKVRELAKLVHEFTNEQVCGKHTRGNTKKLPKYLYYKMGLEAGIAGKDLRLLTKRSRLSDPTDYRTEFTRSFGLNPGNKQIWLSFKAYARMYSSTFR